MVRFVKKKKILQLHRSHSFFIFLTESSEDLTTNISNTNEPLCIIDDRNSNDPAYCVPYVFDIMNHLIACEVSLFLLNHFFFYYLLFF